MFDAALTPYPAIERTSRLGPLARPTGRLSTAELVTLLAAGILATLAVALISPGLRIPGSAILRAALPMICGVALVPRRMAGSVMTAGSALAAIVLTMLRVGDLPAGAVTALFALGPAIDVTMALSPVAGWRLYLRFGLAGILANLLSFAVRAAAGWLTIDPAVPHGIAKIGPSVFLSFAACGLVAGLVSAAVWFRPSARSE